MKTDANVSPFAVEMDESVKNQQSFEPRKNNSAHRSITVPRNVVGGFTLVELLVVVSLIALLISMLLPSLKQAREQAKQVKCASQQRNVGVAIKTYATEFNEYHHAVWANRSLRFRELMGRRYLIRPYTGSGDNLNAGDVYWAAIYDPYLNGKMESYYYNIMNGLGKSKSLPGWENTRCPTAKYTLEAFRRIGGSNTSGIILEHNPFTLWSTLSFNGVTPGGSGIPETVTKTLFEFKDGKRVPLQMDRLKFPGEMIMFHDGSEPMLDGNGDVLTQLTQWGMEGNWDREYFRHPSGSVVSWADGHTDTISKTKAEQEKHRMRTHNGGDVTGAPLRWYSHR